MEGSLHLLTILVNIRITLIIFVGENRFYCISIDIIWVYDLSCKIAIGQWVSQPVNQSISNPVSQIVIEMEWVYITRNEDRETNINRRVECKFKIKKSCSFWFQSAHYQEPDSLEIIVRFVSYGSIGNNCNSGKIHTVILQEMCVNKTDYGRIFR